MTHDSTPGVPARELRALLAPFISKRVDPQDVEDVLQTVFVQLQRGLADLRDSTKLVAWAYQVARNAIVDHARKAGIRQHDPLDRDHTAAAPLAAPDIDEIDDSGASELALVLGDFIQMLPEPYREALVLTEIGGVPQVEAARRTGLSSSGMKSRVQRARAQLRELLEACCEIELDARGGIIEVEPRNRPPELPDCCDQKLRPSLPPPVSRDMTNTENVSPTTTTNTTTEEKPASACCGGPAPAGTAACCVKDAAAKAAGESGCGCGSKAGSRAKSSCC